jgi:hypothetical protein
MNSLLEQLEKGIPKGEAIDFNGVTVFFMPPSSDESSNVTIQATLLAESEMEAKPEAEKMKTTKANKLDFREWVNANEGKLTESEKNADPETLYDFVKLQRYASLKNVLMLSVCISDESGKRLFKTVEEQKQLCIIIEKSPSFIRNFSDVVGNKGSFLAQKQETTD